MYLPPKPSARRVKVPQCQRGHQKSKIDINRIYRDRDHILINLNKTSGYQNPGLYGNNDANDNSKPEIARYAPTTQIQ